MPALLLLLPRAGTPRWPPCPSARPEQLLSPRQGRAGWGSGSVSSLQGCWGCSPAPGAPLAPEPGWERAEQTRFPALLPTAGAASVCFEARVPLPGHSRAAAAGIAQEPWGHPGPPRPQRPEPLACPEPVSPSSSTREATLGSPEGQEPPGHPVGSGDWCHPPGPAVSRKGWRSLRGCGASPASAMCETAGVKN